MFYPLIKTLASFGLILGSAFSGGLLARRVRLPKITGFLVTGLIAGPSVLGFLSHQDLQSLQALDHYALCFIAILAGSELGLDTIKSRLKSILGVMFGLILVTSLIGMSAVILLGDWLPFLKGEVSSVHWAAASLAGVIMTARSPSAAIAVIGETKSQGPFTQLILGVTVLMDAVVIALFAVALSAAHSLVDQRPLSLHLLQEVGIELILSISIGIIIGLGVVGTLRLNRSRLWRGMILTSCPILILWLVERLHTLQVNGLPLSVEPLLSCVVMGITFNFARQSVLTDIKDQLEVTSPAVYVMFFTLTGASLALDQIWLIWPAAALIFCVRLIGIGAGSTLGGMISGEPQNQHKIRWMGFVTQAGVGLGLAQRVAHDFPAWGVGFATMMTAVIVLNECVGPIFFKRALIHSGEGSALSGTPQDEIQTLTETHSALTEESV